MVMILVEKYTIRSEEDLFKLPRDKNGDFIYPEEGTYERDVIAVAPQMTSVDDEPNRRMILTGIEIYDTADSPINPDDFIIYDGSRFKVDGDNIPHQDNPHSVGLGMEGKIIPAKLVRG